MQILQKTMAALLALTSPAALHAQDNEVDVKLNMLTHGEMRHGGLGTEESTDNRANFIMGRARLTVDYRHPGLEARLVGQNSAVWGASGNKTFNLHEAWAKLSTRQGLFLQAGRQVLAYDDERIIGPNDWAMASLSHDVLRAGYEGHGHKAHLILAYNQNSDNVIGGSYYSVGAQPYKSMHTLWYHYDVPRLPLSASLLMMNIGMQAGTEGEDDRTEYQHLIGGYAHFAPSHWKAELSYYVQKGHDENGIKMDAWMFASKLQYKPTPSIGFTAGFDYLSGDDKFAVPGQGFIGLTRHEVIKGFNPIYGSHHKFYGAMDFFYVSTYVNGFTPGLQNAFAGVTCNPLRDLSLNASYHYLAIAANLGMDKTLGHELEFEAAYKLSPLASLSAGFSYMTGTDTMDRLKRSTADGKLTWGWAKLVITPQTFTTKW